MINWLSIFKKSSIYIIFTLFISSSLYAQCLDGDCNNGYGTYQFKSGTIYIGNYKNSKFFGYGILISPAGDKFIGYWVNGQRNGYGKLLIPDGRRYEGMFKENRFNGFGSFKYSDESIYTGLWNNGVANGVGKLKLIDGSLKQGQWEQGRLVTSFDITEEIKTYRRSLKNCSTSDCGNGFGSLTFIDGSKWEGQFQEGSPSGIGVCYYTNGDIYFGKWLNRKPNGYGQMQYTDGKIKLGFWQDGILSIQNEDVEESESYKPQVPFQKQVKIYALIVGSAQYKNLPTLKYTDDDAYLLYAFFKSPQGGAVPDQQINILIDESATRENILKLMKNTFSKADKNDVILLYLAGHGINGYYLPIESNGYENRISYEEIKQILEKSEAKHKICITDACHSGSLLAERSAYGESLDLFYSTFENTKGGTAFLLSSKAEETSLEASGGMRQGIFSHYLLEGLKGKSDINADGIINIKELFDYVHDSVQTFTNNAQTPIIAGNYSDFMPVGMVRK